LKGLTNVKPAVLSFVLGFTRNIAHKIKTPENKLGLVDQFHKPVPFLNWFIGTGFNKKTVFGLVFLEKLRN